MLDISKTLTIEESERLASYQQEGTTLANRKAGKLIWAALERSIWLGWAKQIMRINPNA